MTRICFVTQEIYPLTSGGAGSLISNSIQVLYVLGYEITLLLDLPEETTQKAQIFFQGKASVYGVYELIDPNPEKNDTIGSYYYDSSYRLYQALQNLIFKQKIDFIEFNDFYGPSYYSLLAKVSGLCFEEIKIGVRLHNTWELLLRFGDGSDLQNYILEIRAVERAALRLSEYILTPSETYYQNIIQPIYAVSPGSVQISPPALLTWPKELKAPGEMGNIILFFGRLQPFKGIDRFLSSCLEFMTQEPGAETWIVGGDSQMTGEGNSLSYQEMLIKRIPEGFRDRFHFTGRLTHIELSTVLPRVRFAVIPGYLESFCYAAHELYRARIPLILSRMPGIVDYFHHEKNALLFDGSVGDLTKCMQRLYYDVDLRERIRYPYPVVDNELGGFYQNLKSQCLTGQVNHLSLKEIGFLILVLCDVEEGLPVTLTSLKNQISGQDQLLILKKKPAQTKQLPLVLFDSVYYLFDANDNPVSSNTVHTKDSLLILKSGDRLHVDAIITWRNIFAHNKSISFAGSWQNWKNVDGSQQCSKYPYEINTDELIFHQRPIRLRYALRTPVNTRLDDIFDILMGEVGEIDYLWKQDETYGPGIVVPIIFVDCCIEEQVVIVKEYALPVSYLIAKDQSQRRQKNMALRSAIQARNEIAQKDYPKQQMKIVWEKMGKYPRAQKMVVNLLEKIRKLL